jgi:hypothetical protein
VRSELHGEREERGESRKEAGKQPGSEGQAARGDPWWASLGKIGERSPGEKERDSILRLGVFSSGWRARCLSLSLSLSFSLKRQGETTARRFVLSSPASVEAEANPKEGGG